MSSLLRKWNATAIAPARTTICEVVLLDDVLNGDPSGPSTTTENSDQPGFYVDGRRLPMARFVGKTPERHRGFVERIGLMLKGMRYGIRT